MSKVGGDGQARLSLSLVIPLTKKPAHVPTTGISIHDERNNRIGPEKRWTVTAGQEISGYWQVELSTAV